MGLTVGPRLLQNSQDSSAAKTEHILTPAPEFSFLNPHDSSDSLLRARDYQLPVARTFELDLQSGPDGAKFCTEGLASTGWDTATLPCLWTLSLLIYIQSQRDGQKYQHPAWNIRTHHSAQGFNKTLGLILASVTHKQPGWTSSIFRKESQWPLWPNKRQWDRCKRGLTWETAICSWTNFLKIIMPYWKTGIAFIW